MAHPVADPFDLVERIVNGVLDVDALRWVQRGFLTWIRSDGEIPLERCLHLPRTAKQLQRLRRDEAIRDVGRLLEAPTSYALAKEMERELGQFIERGPWRHWRDFDTAPEQASKLRAALFVAVKCNGGASLSVKQLQRILDKDSI